MDALTTILSPVVVGMSEKELELRMLYYGLSRSCQYWRLSKSYITNSGVALLPSRPLLKRLGLIFVDGSDPTFDSHAPPFNWSSEVECAVDPVTKHFVWQRKMRDQNNILRLHQSFEEGSKNSDCLMYWPSA